MAGQHGQRERLMRGLQHAGVVAGLALIFGVVPVGSTAGAAPAPGVRSAAHLAAGARAGRARNGITKMTARRALAESLAELRAAPDLAISGTIHQAGSGVRLATESAHHGSSAEGTLTATTTRAGFAGTLHFVSIGATDYLKGGAAFWKAALAHQPGATRAQRAALARKLASSWVRLTGTEGAAFTSGLGVLTKPAALATELTVGHGRLRKGKLKRIGGRPALPITSSKGGTVWLATTGKPLPLEVTSPKRSAASGTVRLAYPRRVTITAPKRSKTLTQLGL